MLRQEKTSRSMVGELFFHFAIGGVLTLCLTWFLRTGPGAGLNQFFNQHEWVSIGILSGLLIWFLLKRPLKIAGSGQK